MKICFIGNIASHYRSAIFRKMADELHCDFYFGRPCEREKSIALLPMSFFYTHAEDFPRKYLGKSNFTWISGVFKIFGKYDVYIWTGEPFCLTSWLFALGIKLFTRQKIVYWTHGWYGRENRIRKIFKKLYFGMADHIMPYGDYAKNLMIQEGFPPEKISAIHNSLNYDEQVALRSKITEKLIANHFGNDRATIFFSGRLVASKRLDIMLQALRQLAAEGKMINCVVVGDGPERENLQRLAREWKIENHVWFYGACYDEKILCAFFAEASLTISPGNVGLTAIHSLTFGCPVITHNNFLWQGPEFEAIIPGRTGDFFAQNNLAEIKYLIQKWCCLSPAKREEVRAACYQEIEMRWNPYYQIRILHQVVENFERG